MPNKKNSLERSLNIIVFANVVILCSDTFYITLNGSMYLFLLFIKLCKSPVILDEFSVFLSFSLENVSGIIQETISEQKLPNFRSNTIWDSVPRKLLYAFELNDGFRKLFSVNVDFLNLGFLDGQEGYFLPENLYYGSFNLWGSGFLF